jgi:hypothetical protein
MPIGGSRGGATKQPTVKGRGTRATEQPAIDFKLSLEASRKRALKQALQSALIGISGGPWIAILRSALIYETPSEGTWWWSVALTSGTGTLEWLLVPPHDQTPAALAALVSTAARGELFTVLCAGCKSVRLNNRTWHRRSLPSNLARVSHRVCPPCSRQLYPQVSRHAGR